MPTLHPGDHLDGRVGKVEHRAPLLSKGPQKTSNKIRHVIAPRFCAEPLAPIKELKR
jgi:hypothetical protein